VEALLSPRDDKRWTRVRVVSVYECSELLNIYVSEPLISLEKWKNEVGGLSYFMVSHSPTSY